MEPLLWSLGDPKAILNDSFLFAFCLNSSWILLLIVLLPKMTLLVFCLHRLPCSTLPSLCSSYGSSWQLSLSLYCSPHLGSSSVLPLL